MIKIKDFVVGWRILIKEPVYSMIVTFGLSVGFATFFLLLHFVHYSFNFDAQAPDRDHLYVVKSRANFFEPAVWMRGVPWPFQRVANGSELVQATSLAYVSEVVARTGNQIQKINLSIVDANFPQLFGVRTLDGDLQAALTLPDAAAITMSTAEKLFGRSNALGEIVQIDGRKFRVVAIVADPPANTIEPYSALVGIGSAAWADAERQSASKDWVFPFGSLYVQLKPDARPSELEQVLQNAADHSPASSQMSSGTVGQLAQNELFNIKLNALSDAYFDPDMENGMSQRPHSDKWIVLSLATVAVLILIMASTNYVNLATVRTAQRQREIGIRKALGARAKHIVAQFLAESLLVALSASLLGLIFAGVLLPIFSELVNCKLPPIFTFPNVLLCLSIGVVVGLAAGGYPAWLAIRMPTTIGLSAGRNELLGGLWLRRLLMVLQFSAAIAFIATTIAITWQTEYATKMNPGFDSSPLLVLHLPDDLRNPQSRAFREQLLQIPGVAAVASSLVAVGENDIMASTRVRRNSGDGNMVGLGLIMMSPDFFETYRVSALAGRLFNSKSDRPDDEKTVVINALAAKELGFDSPETAVGQFLTGGDGEAMQIVGVSPNIHQDSLRDKPRPLIYKLSLKTKVLTVRVDGDLSAAKKNIEKLWQNSFPNDIFEMASAKSILAGNYAADLRMSGLLFVSSVIAVLMAGFGLYVLSAYSVQRRSREIVLRKLYGASRIDIARLMAREIVSLFIVGALLGIPFAMVMTERYLSKFVERASMGIWALLLSLCVAAIVILISISRHTLAAVGIRPVEVLRS